MSQGSLPAWVVSGVLGLALGIGGAIVVTELTKPDPAPAVSAEDIERQIRFADDMVEAFSSPPPPSPEQQLAARVLQVDLLRQVASLDLSAEQRSAVAELLEGIEAEDASREDVQAALDGIDAVLTEGQREVMAGLDVTVPGGGRPPPGEPPVNPLAAESVQSALERLRDNGAPDAGSL